MISLATLKLSPSLPYRFGPHEFWPTPVWVAEALFEKFQPPTRKVGEVAAGEGDLVDVLQGRGHEVRAVELRPSCYPKLSPRCPTIIGDWLELAREPEKVKLILGEEPFSIVTNPPFSLALRFTETCLSVGAVFVALLLPSSFPYSLGRAAFNRKHPPTGVVHIAQRPSFDGKGSPKRDCYWSIWEEGKPAMPFHTATKKGGNNVPIF